MKKIFKIILIIGAALTISACNDKPNSSNNVKSGHNKNSDNKLNKKEQEKLNQQLNALKKSEEILIKISNNTTDSEIIEKHLNNIRELDKSNLIKEQKSIKIQNYINQALSDIELIKELPNSSFNQFTEFDRILKKNNVALYF